VRNRFINSIAGVSIIGVAALFVTLLPAAGQTKPAGKAAPAPRTLDGKPDLSGVWDHPFVVDMSKDSTSDRCGAAIRGCSQKGPGGELPMTPWAEEWTKNYDATDFDSSAQCNPLGYTRSQNSPTLTQIVQTPKELAFLHESFFVFHVVYLDGRRHPTFEEARETMWYGHSVGHWEKDTMVIDTVGPFFGSPMMILDTRGHPMSDQLHLVERITRTDRDTLAYEITVEDPKAFTRPWKNNRIWKLMPASEEIMEYACAENNKEVREGLISTKPSEKQKAPGK
jgi:hypothetical protein